MDSEDKNDKRQYERYDTEIDIYFQVNYDVQTKVKYQKIDKTKGLLAAKKYSAISKNISAEGLCFRSERKLEIGDILYLEVYLPTEKDPIPMEGEVRWSQPIADSPGAQEFDTGVKILMVKGKSVTASIHFDKYHKIVWSVVLESVLGSFRILNQRKDKNQSS